MTFFFFVNVIGKAHCAAHQTGNFFRRWPSLCSPPNNLFMGFKLKGGKKKKKEAHQSWGHKKKSRGCLLLLPLKEAPKAPFAASVKKHEREKREKENRG